MELQLGAIERVRTLYAKFLEWAPAHCGAWCKFAELERSLGGIKEMGGLPDILFIIDTNKEKLAVEEANKLGIPVVAVLDSNSDPQGITFPIPGNDDAARALQLSCDLMADAVLDGLTEGQVALGVDIGAAEAPLEPALRMTAAIEPGAEVEAPAAPEPELEAAFTDEAPASEG